MREFDAKALEAAAEEIVKRTGWLRSDCEEITRAAVTAYLAEAGDGRLSELERENAELREALKPFAAQTRASSLTEEKMILAARAALAGSGEK
jgi:hypothetical protein